MPLSPEMGFSQTLEHMDIVLAVILGSAMLYRRVLARTGPLLLVLAFFTALPPARLGARRDKKGPARLTISANRHVRFFKPVS